MFKGIGVEMLNQYRLMIFQCTCYTAQVSPYLSPYGGGEGWLFVFICGNGKFRAPKKNTSLRERRSPTW